jgi:hypothetical protein
MHYYNSSHVYTSRRPSTIVNQELCNHVAHAFIALYNYRLRPRRFIMMLLRLFFYTAFLDLIPLLLLLIRFLASLMAIHTFVLVVATIINAFEHPCEALVAFTLFLLLRLRTTWVFWVFFLLASAFELRFTLGEAECELTACARWRDL